MLRVDCIETEHDFVNLKSRWNELLAMSRANNPFLTWEWGFSWWQALKDNNIRLKILLYHDGDELVAIAPLVIREVKLYKLFRIKKLEFIGSEIANGEYLDFITEEGAEAQAAKAFAKVLASETNWQVIELFPWNEHSKSLTYFYQSCISYHLTPYVFLRTICPVVNFESDWSGYRNSLKKSTRKKTEYQKRRLLKEHDVVFGQCNSYEEVKKHLPKFFDLHQKRWTLKGEQGSFSNGTKRRLYAEMSRWFCDRDWLRMYYLQVQDRIVSYIFGIEYNKCFFDLQTTFDMDWEKRSVGTVLLYHSLEQSIKKGLVSYDFLRGEEKYKYQWGATPKRNMRILIFQPGILHTLYRLLRRKKTKSSVNLLDTSENRR